MKLRYYMRGLGIGILVTAVLMSLVLHGKANAMSDEAVMARARELGMEMQYNNSVLADIVSENNISGNNTLKKPSPSDKQNGTQSVEYDSEALNALDRAQQSIESSEKAAEEAMEKVDAAAEQAGKINSDLNVGTGNGTDSSDTAAGQETKIVVSGGDQSLSVARKLEQAGLIADAAAFDRYLCKNGYDKRICSGTHTFVQGASEEEIIKELIRKVK